MEIKRVCNPGWLEAKHKSCRKMLEHCSDKVEELELENAALSERIGHLNAEVLRYETRGIKELEHMLEQAQAQLEAVKALPDKWRGQWSQTGAAFYIQCADELDKKFDTTSTPPELHRPPTD